MRLLNAYLRKSDDRHQSWLNALDGMTEPMRLHKLSPKLYPEEYSRGFADGIAFCKPLIEALAKGKDGAA